MLSDLARARAQNLLNGVAQFFFRLGISPNALTLAGFIGVCAIAMVIAAGYEAAGGILLIIAAAFDAVDGTLARTTGRATKFGAFLDSTLDRWAEGVLFIAIILRAGQRGDPLTAVLAAAALLGSLLVSYARARAQSLGADIKDGWFSRFERMLVLIVGLILTAFVGPVALTVAMAILSVFANFTAVQRVFAARRALDS